MTVDHESSSMRDGTVPTELSPFARGTQLRELTRAALRVAMEDAAHGRMPDGAVRAMLREVCAAARACDARVEHLLILLKEACLKLPEARRVNHDDAQDTLARVITLCIEEYYGPRVRREAGRARS